MIYVNRFKKPLNDSVRDKIVAKISIPKRVDGRLVVNTIDAESIIDKFADFSADDFKLQKQLDAGVKMNKVIMNGDVLSSIDNVDKLNAHLDSIQSQAQE